MSGSITGSQSGIVVPPAAASSLVVAGFSSPITAGTTGTFTVTAKDAYGNTATGYTGTVHFSSSDMQAQLSAAYTFTADDNGTHTFTATLFAVGTQSLAATDAAHFLSGTHDGIVVTATSTLGTGLVPAVTAAPATASMAKAASPETPLPPAPPAASALPRVGGDAGWTAAAPIAAQDRLFADFDTYWLADPVGALPGPDRL